MNGNRHVLLIVDANRFAAYMEYEVFLYICGVEGLECADLLEMCDRQIFVIINKHANY